MLGVEMQLPQRRHAGSCGTEAVTIGESPCGGALELAIFVPVSELEQPLTQVERGAVRR